MQSTCHVHTIIAVFLFSPRRCVVHSRGHVHTIIAVFLFSPRRCVVHSRGHVHTIIAVFLFSPRCCVVHSRGHVHTIIAVFLFSPRRCVVYSSCHVHTIIAVFLYSPQTLALCTAGVMFMLSRDRLNMDLDKTSLQLMLNLLSVDSKIPTERAALSEYNRMKKRIQTICENLNVDGKARQFHLDLIDISVSIMTVWAETLY